MKTHGLAVAFFLLHAVLISAATTVADYGVLPNGRAVKRYTLTNANGLRVTLLDYGATLASVVTPDRSGQFADVVHGYDDLAGWLSNPSYFGATVGRYANRIAAGKFSLDGQTFTLASNDGHGGTPGHLHGGKRGFDKKLWSGRSVAKTGASGVEFTYLSSDGEEGYPGALSVKLTYWLTEKNDLVLEYLATTDRPTIVNLTNHAYWNLTGDPRRPITGHELQLEADEFLPVNAAMIPTGAIMSVAGTPFDFRKPTEIGLRIGAADEQLKLGNGYDHCWVLREGKNKDEDEPLAARVVDPLSGRVLELFSNQPGLQFYTGNFLDGKMKGKGGATYPFRSAFCLEPEKFPDAPNHSSFPSATLRPGEVYNHILRYHFSVQ